MIVSLFDDYLCHEGRLVKGFPCVVGVHFILREGLISSCGLCVLCNLFYFCVKFFLFCVILGKSVVRYVS